MADMQGNGVQRTLASIVLVGVTVFLYQAAQVLEKIQSWEVMWNPPTVGQLLMAVVFGLGAVAAAMGLDLPVLAKGLGITLFSKPPD